MLSLLTTLLRSTVFPVLVAFLGYRFFVISYRVWFHPLKRYPGPRLAALTTWYGAWYLAVHDGGLLEQLDKLHKKYGPVVRIGPNELHFSNPSAYTDIYNTTNKVVKLAEFYDAFGDDERIPSEGGLSPSVLFKTSIKPLFSRRAVQKLEYTIQRLIDTLITQLLARPPDKPVDMYFALRSTTLDIIVSYLLAWSPHAVDYPDFQHPLLRALDEVTPVVIMGRYIPFLKPLLLSLPSSMISLLSPSQQGLIDLQKKTMDQVLAYIQDPSQLEHADHDIVFQHLLVMRPEKGLSPPTPTQLRDNAISLMVAGSDTVGNACTIALFHIMKLPCVYRKLMDELLAAWPDKDTKVGLEVLEKLPYLTAVIKESLRLSHGTVTGLPRQVAVPSLSIDGMQIPLGTIVSIGATFVHLNSEVFPEPSVFSPERWLQPDSAKLEKYLVAFTKGPRTCLGINLAWCELYLILGNMFRKLEFEIYKTMEQDLKFRAWFIPIYRGYHLHSVVKEKAL